MYLQKDPLTIHWGLEEETNLVLKSTSIGTVVQIGNQEFIGITQSKLVRFDSSAISTYLPYQLTALISILEHQILVGITAISAEFIIISLSDVKTPILPKVKTNDASIFNMIYLPKSKLLITSGEDLKVWKFDYYYNSKSVIPTLPFIQIEYQRTIISKFQGSILNPPIVDFTTEILYIDDQNGSLQMYKVTTGENIGCALKFQSKSKTTIGYNHYSKKFLTSNSDQGTILYHKSGSLNNRYLLSNVAALAIRFINKEYAIVLDAHNLITILDVKTSRNFACYKAEKPIKRIFLFEHPVPRLVLCFNSDILVFRVVLPWSYWKSTISTPISMVRCPKYEEAARLLVMCSNSHLKLISPSLKVTLTAATLSSLASPISNNFFYDRGCKDIKRDQLMLPLRDGQIQIFSTGENPCKLVSSIESKAMCICLCRYKNKKCFVLGTSAGNLLFYDYQTLEKVHRVVLVPFPIIKIYYCGYFDDIDIESDSSYNFDDSLCLVYKDRLMRYSIKDEKTYESLLINGSELSISFNEIMIFAYENGEIGSAYFDKSINCDLVEHVTNGLKIHDDKITGLSVGLESDYFASSSLDMSLRIWSTSDITLIKKIVFPVQLFSVAVLNGKRDVVVGTECEIMMVDSRILFGNVVDEEDEEFDNYDHKYDFLSNQFAQIVKESQENEVSLLDGRKYDENNENRKIKKTKNSRLKRIAEALKKHEELMSQKLNDDLNKNEETRKSAKKEVMDADERERLYLQMNEITNGKPKRPVNIPKDELKGNNKKKEKEYEYEYEYENYEEEKNESESEDSAQSDSISNQIQSETIETVDNPIPSQSQDEHEQENEKDDTVVKIKLPTMRNENRSPKRQYRRSAPQREPIFSNETLNNTNRDGNEHSQDESDSKSIDEHDSISNKSHFNQENKSETNKRHSKSGYKQHHSQNHVQDSESTQKHNKHDSKHHHRHKNESDRVHKTNTKIKTNSKPEKTNSKANNSSVSFSSRVENAQQTKMQLSGPKDTSNPKNTSNSKDISNLKNTSNSLFASNPLDCRTKMNLFLISNTIDESAKHSKHNQANKNKPNQARCNSSLQPNSNQQMIRMKPTRRFPTPLGYHFVHPGLSLFERSIKKRRPKTPDKKNNGLIISHSVVPTNIIIDASALNVIIESEDEHYRPLINQIRPLLRSNYVYYKQRMRSLERFHAHFNLNVMLPAYQRNRRQIQKQIDELKRITENEKVNENSALIVPPLNIDDLSSNQKKPKSLLDIGKNRHSYDEKETFSYRKKSPFNSPSIIKPDKKNQQRKSSCPPKLHKPIILPALPESSRNPNLNRNKFNHEYDEYNNFISSLYNRKDKKIFQKKQNPFSFALPNGSLYVTGRPMLTKNLRNPKISQKYEAKQKSSNQKEKK